MKLSTKLGALAIILGVSGMAYGTTFAYRGDSTVKGPNYSDARHTAMQDAFEHNDYNAWKNLMEGKGRVTQVINEDNFSEFAEMNRLMNEGNIEKAREIRQELGLGLHSGAGKGNGEGMHRNTHTSTNQ